MILLEPLLITGSALGILGITVRRFLINARVVTIQQQVAQEQRKEEREKSRMRFFRNRKKVEASQDELEKKVLRQNMVRVNELMAKVEQLLEAKEEEEALKMLIQITALDRDHRKAQELLANLYLKHDQPQKAELIYQTLIEQYPHDPLYHSNLGHSYYNRRQFKSALELYEKALELDKASPIRYINLGHVYVAKRELATAVEYYKKASRLSVRDIDLMFTVVETCLNNQDPITAREYLHKVLDYEPYNTRAKEMLAQVLDLLKRDSEKSASS